MIFNIDNANTNKVSQSGIVNVQLQSDTEYTLTNVTSLTMTMNAQTSECSGMVTFASVPMISITGYVAFDGDDIGEAVGGEQWEFNVFRGCLIWKNWGHIA